LLKNRRKDGGYYWVRANVTPIFSEGKTVGYMSYRTQVSEHEKQLASKAYQDIHSVKAKIYNGQIYHGMRLSKLNPSKNWRPEFQLLLMLTLFAVVSVVAMALLADQPLWMSLIPIALILMSLCHVCRMN